VAHVGDARQAKPHLEHNPLSLLGARNTIPMRKLNDPGDNLSTSTTLESNKSHHPLCDRARVLTEGDSNFSIAAGGRGIHGGSNPVKIQADTCPFRRTRQHHKSNPSSCKILLVSYPLVCGEQDINRRLLGGIQQCAVRQPVPALRIGGDDGMAGQCPGNASGRPMIKENAHQQVSSQRQPKPSGSGRQSQALL